MTTETIIANTKQMIDDLKTVCANFGLGNASSEYKIITEIFLYKFLNDKFLYEVQQADERLKDSENVEQTLNNMPEDDYEMLMMQLPAATAKLKREHFISYLFNHKNDDKFNELFDATLWDISNTNLDVFSVSTGSGDKIRLFDQNLSLNVTESNRRSDFCRAMIDKLVTFSFADAFSQKYDFFATIFEYLIKDYNKDFGKYAEYYTPHSIASIIARIMVPQGTQNVTNGTLDFTGCDTIDESARTIVHNRSDIQIGDILFASIAPLGRCYLIQAEPTDWDINESVFSIRANIDVVTPTFLYLYFMSDAFIKQATSSSTGSIFKGIRISTLLDTELCVPPLSVITQFEDKLASTLSLKSKSCEEIQKLTNLRDWLLPMLMNGQATIEN